MSPTQVVAPSYATPNQMKTMKRNNENFLQRGKKKYYFSLLKQEQRVTLIVRTIILQPEYFSSTFHVFSFLG